MSKLSVIHKQIAALQAEAERITRQEMSVAIAKVKGLMSEFGLTIEHLTQSVIGKSAAKKSRATKAKTASVAKYADPKTGKTWSGFGRAPGWIAGAKNRDAFLVEKSGVKVAKPAVKAPVTAKKAAGKIAKAAKKTANPAGKRMKAEATAAAAAKPAGKASATKSATAKKAAAKTVAKTKAAAKKAPGRKAPATDAAPTHVESPATAA